MNPTSRAILGLGQEPELITGRLPVELICVSMESISHAISDVKQSLQLLPRHWSDAFAEHVDPIKNQVEQQVSRWWRESPFNSESDRAASSWRPLTAVSRIATYRPRMASDRVLSSQSMSLGSQGGSRPPQPLHELAMAKDEVKARLAPIPVFTVANPKNEFVLVAGEVSVAWLRYFHAARKA